jgi:drug/metabolite transporter (DMT)-like permease
VVLLQQQLQPIWAVLAAAVLLRERITKGFVFWAIVALVAAYATTFKSLHVNLSYDRNTIVAALYAIGAGFMWGSSTAISKVVLRKVHFLTATSERFFLAPIFAFLFILQQGQVSALHSLSAMQAITLLIITFSTGMVALSIYYYGLKRTPARISSICELAFPGAAVVIDYFYYHNSLSITQVLGIAFLILCMYKITQPLQKNSPELTEKFSRT